MTMRLVRILTTLALTVLTTRAVAQETLENSSWREPPPVKERLAVVSNLDQRLEKLQKALDSVSDQKSLSATTARYILNILKEAKENPSALESRSAARGAGGAAAARGAGGAAPARGAGGAAPAFGGGRGDSDPVPENLPKTYSAYISNHGLTMDFDAELKRAEQLAVDIKAGRDPLAGIKGDVHLAYRSDLDGFYMPFRIYVPSAYNKNKKYPLIMFLHGANCDENTFMNPGLLQAEAEVHGYLIASINGRGPMNGYSKRSGAQKDLFDVMALMQKYYNIDPQDIFLSGHSMGGMATWTVGMAFRDKFAALAPLAGTTSIADELLSSGKKIPILITAGGRDTTFSPAATLEVYKKLKAAGYPAKIVEYPDADHNGVFLCSAGEVFNWFDKYKK